MNRGRVRGEVCCVELGVRLQVFEPPNLLVAKACWECSGVSGDRERSACLTHCESPGAHGPATHNLRRDWNVEPWIGFRRVHAGDGGWALIKAPC